MFIEYTTSNASGSFEILIWEDLHREALRDIERAKRISSNSFFAFIYLSGSNDKGKRLDGCLVIFPGDVYQADLEKLLATNLPMGLRRSRVIIGIFKDHAEMSRTIHAWEKNAELNNDLGLITVRTAVGRRDEAEGKKRDGVT